MAAEFAKFRVLKERNANESSYARLPSAEKIDTFRGTSPSK